MFSIRKTMALAALGGAALVSGAGIATAVNSTGSAPSAVAATDTGQATTDQSTTGQPTTDQAPPHGAPDPSKGGHRGKDGKAEELLTGDLKTKAEAAAKAAVPDGTVDRVETDVEGDTYEAHMTKADGSRVTVKFDADFKVVTIEDGPSGGPMGGPPRGQAPQGQAPQGQAQQGQPPVDPTATTNG